MAQLGHKIICRLNRSRLNAILLYRCLTLLGRGLQLQSNVATRIDIGCICCSFADICRVAVIFIMWAC